MRFHLEDFWGMSPSRFVWAPRCCEKLMETGKNITSSTMESSLDGKLLLWLSDFVSLFPSIFYVLVFSRLGIAPHRWHLMQASQRAPGPAKRRKVKDGHFSEMPSMSWHKFWAPRNIQFYLLFTSNIVFCVSFVSFLFPPSLKNSPKTISCPRPASPIIWATCGAPMATPKEWPRHIQNSMNSGIILGYFDLRQSVVSRFYNIQYSGIIPNIQNMQKMYIGSLWSSEIIYK